MPKNATARRRTPSTPARRAPVIHTAKGRPHRAEAFITIELRDKIRVLTEARKVKACDYVRIGLEIVVDPRRALLKNAYALGLDSAWVAWLSSTTAGAPAIGAAGSSGAR